MHVEKDQMIIVFESKFSFLNYLVESELDNALTNLKELREMMPPYRRDHPSDVQLTTGIDTDHPGKRQEAEEVATQAETWRLERIAQLEEG